MIFESIYISELYSPQKKFSNCSLDDSRSTCRPILKSKFECISRKEQHSKYELVFSKIFKLPTMFIISPFVSDVIGTQVVTFSDSNSLTIAEQNTSLSPLVLIENPTINRTSINRSKSKAVKKRRRLRKKKKRPRVNMSTTIIPNVSTVKYPNETVAVRKKHKRRKLKKRRKQVNRTRKGNIQLESKSLVLPIIPTQTTSVVVLPITSTRSAPVQRKFKKTRCSKNNGGCAHICHPKGTQKCHCFRGFTLAKDKFDCTGKFSNQIA